MPPFKRPNPDRSSQLALIWVAALQEILERFLIVSPSRQSTRRGLMSVLETPFFWPHKVTDGELPPT